MDNIPGDQFNVRTPTYSIIVFLLFIQYSLTSFVSTIPNKDLYPLLIIFLIPDNLIKLKIDILLNLFLKLQSIKYFITINNKFCRNWAIAQRTVLMSFPAAVEVSILSFTQARPTPQDSNSSVMMSISRTFLLMRSSFSVTILLILPSFASANSLCRKVFQSFYRLCLRPYRLLLLPIPSSGNSLSGCALERQAIAFCLTLTWNAKI